MDYKKPVAILVVFLSIHSLNKTYSQDGAWIEYSLDGFGSGAYMSDCGENICAFTRGNSQYVLIFDSDIGGWVKADLGEEQVFKYLQIEGSVVLGWSEDLLFGYSAITADWDTISYEGLVLKEDNNQLYRSYGCSENIAFFVSDKMCYVFDNHVGSWQAYDYGYPTDFSYGMYYPKKDHILFTLVPTDYYDDIKNVVYSAYTASFNVLEDGCYQTLPDYDLGYCCIKDKTGFGDEYRLIGYSALDNQFDVIPYVTEDNESGIIYYEGNLAVDSLIAYSLCFRTVVTPYILVKAKFYGYSTKLGEWNTVNYDIDWEAERYYGSGYFTGKYAMDHGLEQDSQKWRFYFYNAENGGFSKINTDLVYTSTTSSFTVGGSVFGVFDAEQAWGYNPINGNGSLVGLSHEHSANFSAAEDYFTLSRWSESSDTMRIYFYNSTRNNWQWKDFRKNLYDLKLITPHVYLYNMGTDKDVIIYSSYCDSIIFLDFNGYVNSEIEGKLVSVSSDAKSILLNAENCTIHEKDFKFNQTGLGSGSAAFFDKTSKTLYGYSAISNQWTTSMIQEDPNLTIDNAYIGLVTTQFNGDYQGKFYAYNSLAGSWVELTPVGNHIASVLGNKTAMVVRQNYVYAFDPFDTSGVEAIDDNRIQADIILEKNYPNPFKNYTTIKYTLIQPAWVVVKIFDALGRDVYTLVNTYQPAGEWSITWDGRNSSHQEISPGIYFYQLKTGSSVTTRRMVLLAD